MKAHLKQQPLYFQIVLIGGFIFIALALFALGSSIYRDVFQVGGFINQAVATIEQQKAELASMPSELAYAQTPQFQERTAKELLGLKLRDEEVIVLATEEQDLADLLPDYPDQRTDLELLSNPQRWARYLFGF
jgi:cell division protein FtsL